MLQIFLIALLSTGISSWHDFGTQLEREILATPKELQAMRSKKLAEASGEEDPENLEDYEEPHERMQFHNWDYRDLDTIAFDSVRGELYRDEVLDYSECPDDWVRFSDSCYYFEHELLGFANAEKRCFEKTATLMVANSVDEWEAVSRFSPKGFFSWIGLVRFTQFEKYEDLPRWQTEGAISPNKLDWLIKPYKPISNGWSSLANCATHYNPLVMAETASFTYYYPCISMFHSICERNATIANSYSYLWRK